MQSGISKDLSSMTILVVDDLADNRHSLTTLLIANGYENVVEASSGSEALQLLTSDMQIDLVLLDVLMPEMDGREVLAYMKSRTELQSIPAIMVTALDDVDSVIECIEHGAEDYLIKPVDEVILRARVRAVLIVKRICNATDTKAESGTDQDTSNAASEEDAAVNMLQQPSGGF